MACIPQEIFQQFRKDEWELSERRKAANFIIPVYEKHAQYGDHVSDHAYFAFGHLGLLSQLYRHAAAQDLYHHLADTVEQYRKIYDTIKLRVIAHSHGSNIVINLSDQEDIHHKNLVIDDLVMFGTPLQIENAHRASIHV